MQAEVWACPTPAICCSSGNRPACSCPHHATFQTPLPCCGSTPRTAAAATAPRHLTFPLSPPNSTCLRHTALQVFLGTLRDSEVERVNDKVGQAVIETCLAMTIFREDITASFLT